MADILYTYGDEVYANLTNKCNCRCTFCIRFQTDGLGSADTLWHQNNPDWNAVKAAMDAFDFTGYKELVFCGYGEPTCALDLLLKAAKYAKETYGLKTRLNTNGLGNLENGRNIVPELSNVIDSVSISLNAENAKAYEAVTRPTFPNAYEAMLSFAKECGKAIPDVRFTIVDVLQDDAIEECRARAKEAGVPLRIRHFSHA